MSKVKSYSESFLRPEFRRGVLNIGHKFVASAAVCALLSACDTPKPVGPVNAQSLLERDYIIMSVDILDDTGVVSTAYNKREGSERGAARGAGDVAGGWAGGGELSLWTLVLAPVVIPVTVGIGAGVGAAAGSAGGTVKSRDQIEASIQILEAAFQPEKYDRALENLIVEAMRTGPAGASGICVTSVRNRPTCPSSADAARLTVSAAIWLLPSQKNAGTGNIDFHMDIRMLSSPTGVVHPACATWAYRRPAGNLFELAGDNGEPVMVEYRGFLAAMAKEFPAVLFAGRRQLPEGWERTGRNCQRGRPT